MIACAPSEDRHMLIHSDRLFPAEPSTRKVAKELYEHVRTLPIVSPHGHTQAKWFAANESFPGPTQLFAQPDHYIFRMLYSQGILPGDLEIGEPELKDPRKVWRIFASHYYLFRGTPTRMWLDFAFQELFGLEKSCRRRPPIFTLTRSRQSFRRRNFALALSTIASISKSWRQPILLSTR